MLVDSDDAVAEDWFAQQQETGFEPPTTVNKKRRRLLLDDSDSDAGGEAEAAATPSTPAADSDDDILAELAAPAAPAPSSPPDPFDDLFGDGDDDGAGAGVPAAPQSDNDDDDEDEEEEEVSEAEEVPDPASASTTEESEETQELTIKAVGIRSFDPPIIKVKCGKGPTAHDRDLCGELAREVSCPLFQFVVRVHPLVKSDPDSPDVISSIVKVVAGPCIDAEKKAAAMQKDRAGAGAGAGATVSVPTKVTLGAARRAISGSEYFPEDSRRNQAALLATEIVRLVGGGVRGTPLGLEVPFETMEKIAPSSGSSRRSWALRNIYESAEFFTRANYVGGEGVRAINALPGDKAALWKIVQDFREGWWTMLPWMGLKSRAFWRRFFSPTR